MPALQVLPLPPARSQPLVQKLCRGRPEEPLNDGTHARLRRRAVFFGDKIPGEEGFKVDAPKLWATIDKAFLWQALVTLDADPQGHHH